MAVYVDEAMIPFGGMLMSHMWADSLEELLAMADKIDVQRKWIQGHPTLSFGKHREASWVHFDISKGKRTKAIELGAIPTDKYGPAEHVARLDGNTKMLAMIQKARALNDESRGTDSKIDSGHREAS